MTYTFEDVVEMTGNTSRCDFCGEYSDSSSCGCRVVIPAKYGHPSTWGVKKANRLYKRHGWLRTYRSELDEGNGK